MAKAQYAYCIHIKLEYLKHTHKHQVFILGINEEMASSSSLQASKGWCLIVVGVAVVAVAAATPLLIFRLTLIIPLQIHPTGHIRYHNNSALPKSNQPNFLLFHSSKSNLDINYQVIPNLTIKVCNHTLNS